MPRRRDLVALSALAALTGVAAPSGAWRTIRSAAAATGAQPLSPVQRFSVGDMVVTALGDGYLDIETKMLLQADPAAVEALQASAFLPAGPAIRTSINAYLVEMGERRILIDAGTRDFVGPTAGKLPASLDAIGVAPASITTIVLTHLHPDHAGGLAAADGTALFPSAELMLAEAEHGFWAGPEALDRAPDAMKPFVQIAQSAIRPYADRLRLFTPGIEVAPGLTSVALSGHTPGHTGYRLTSGGDSLLIWGDVAHLAALQLPRPEWAIAFDTDPTQAVASRQRLLDEVATDRLAVAGMHLDFPGIGNVERVASGGYRFVPGRWQFQL